MSKTQQPSWPPEDPRLQALRAQLPATLHQVYLNTGTCGPLPCRTVEILQREAAEELRGGRIGPARFERVREQLSRTRQLLASLIGARADQIALTGRTTDGLNIVLWGLRWQPGDQVLTTRHEHPGLLVPLASLARRYGVEVRYLPIDGDHPQQFVERVAAALTPRTRLLALSHVLWTNGLVLPIADITRLAHEAGARVLVDGAQAVGAIPVDVRACGVDFYALSGQKWLCGPEGTGALYVSDEALAAVEPTFSGYATAASVDPFAPHFLPQPGAQRFEVGVPYVPLFAAWSESLRWLGEEIGLAFITQRIAALATWLRSQLLNVEGVHVLTPSAGAGGLVSGLVSFRLQGRTAESVVTDLAARRYVARSIPGPFAAVRISTGFYNTFDELASLVQVIRELAH